MGSTKIVTPRASLDDLAEARWDQILPHVGGLEYADMFTYSHKRGEHSVVTNNSIFDEHLFGTKELELVIRSTDEGNLLVVRPVSYIPEEETPEMARTPAPETWHEVVKWCRMVAAMQSPI